MQKTFAQNDINITFAVPKRHQTSLEPQWPVRLGVRTGDFHSSNRGSIPLRATNNVQICKYANVQMKASTDVEAFFVFSLF